MTEELPWFFHAVKHGINIEELKEWVLKDMPKELIEILKKAGKETW